MQVKVAVQYMRKAIQKKAHFDIMDLDTVQVTTESDRWIYFEHGQLLSHYYYKRLTGLLDSQVAKKAHIPALFGHATDDAFIQPHHSDLIFKAYTVSLTFRRLCLVSCAPMES